MDYAEFQKKYEQDAEKRYSEYIAMSEDGLLRIIQNGHNDDSYQIWRALQSKGTRKSIPVLYEIVSNFNSEYLIRYHACEALFKIAGINNPELKGMVQYGRDKNGRLINQGQAVMQLKRLIML
jgi:hypothetical protein